MDVEWLILADAAQVVGNKLYLLGGGWETLVVNAGFPIQQHCAVAASIRVPWNETNQRRNVEIEIADEDGRPLVQLAGQVEVGRPPGIPLGADQRTQLAFGVVLSFPTPGAYVVIARIDGEEMKRTSFRVMAGTRAPPRPGIA
jgi:hypothetical protein